MTIPREIQDSIKDIQSESNIFSKRTKLNDENYPLNEQENIIRDDLPISRAFEKGEEEDEEEEYEEDADDKLMIDNEEDNNNDSNNLKTTLPIPSSPNLLSSPANFGLVIDSIYRSSFPRPENFPFLEKLKLKAVLVLIPEPYPEENTKFLQQNDIQFYQVGMSGNKEPFVHVSHSTITRALEIALNPANHPLLIHCNRGKHRTGCLVGCIRRLQDWSLTMIFDEYRRFAFPKTRPLDQQLIELYDDSEIYDRALRNNWLTFRY